MNNNTHTRAHAHAGRHKKHAHAHAHAHARVRAHTHAHRSSEETKLNVSFKNTKQIWLETFGVPYVVPGGMYRGEPPAEYFSTSWALRSGVELLLRDKSDQPHESDKSDHLHPDDKLTLVVPMSVFTEERGQDQDHDHDHVHKHNHELDSIGGGPSTAENDCLPGATIVQVHRHRPLTLTLAPDFDIDPNTDWHSPLNPRRNWIAWPPPWLPPRLQLLPRARRAPSALPAERPMKLAAPSALAVVLPLEPPQPPEPGCRARLDRSTLNRLPSPPREV